MEFGGLDIFIRPKSVWLISKDTQTLLCHGVDLGRTAYQWVQGHSPQKILDFS